MKVVTTPVLAAGYHGQPSRFLTHACVVDGGEVHVLCKRVRASHLVAYYEYLDGPEAFQPPTCPACRGQWEKYQGGK